MKLHKVGENVSIYNGEKEESIYIKRERVKMVYSLGGNSNLTRIVLSGEYGTPVIVDVDSNYEDMSNLIGEDALELSEIESSRDSLIAIKRGEKMVMYCDTKYGTISEVKLNQEQLYPI